MAHGKRREARQKLMRWLDLDLLGFCLVFLHFLYDFLYRSPVDDNKNVKEEEVQKLTHCEANGQDKREDQNDDVPHNSCRISQE